jgi:hypothetical protein
MRVLLSQQREREGDAAAAAAVLDTVLAARLSEYRRIHRLPD